ncbi:hypothetical protein PR048_019261 [Dryococelus australis]|uniref:Uncharacterized protein n=1 Tax=Dryococelus australis TaxID=614101 RepID=A0ABQ9H3A8_9NEOP|nr:hypothetical protein PR048_019261 [Dryococelus australis]
MKGWGKTGDPRENPQTNGIVRHDSHMRKSRVTRPGIEPGGAGMKGRGETGDLRDNPPTNGIVRHDSHLGNPGDPAGGLNPVRLGGRRAC